MKIAVCSGHKNSVVLAYADDEPVTPRGQKLLVVAERHHLNLHCLAGSRRRVEMKKRLKHILTHLKADFSQKWKRRGIRPEDRLTLCLPGISTILDHQVGEDCVRDAGWPVAEPANYCIIDDTYAGLIAAGPQSTQGICAFAGTGASVYMGTPDGSIRNFTPDKVFKLDGFGAMLGDHGSGFRLALGVGQC